MLSPCRLTIAAISGVIDKRVVGEGPALAHQGNLARALPGSHKAPSYGYQ